MFWSRASLAILCGRSFIVLHTNNRKKARPAICLERARDESHPYLPLGANRELWLHADSAPTSNTFRASWRVDYNPSNAILITNLVVTVVFAFAIPYYNTITGRSLL